MNPLARVFCSPYKEMTPIKKVTALNHYALDLILNLKQNLKERSTQNSIAKQLFRVEFIRRYKYCNKRIDIIALNVSILVIFTLLCNC